MKQVKRTLTLLVFAFAFMLIAKPISAEAAAPKLNKSKVTIIVGNGKQLKVKNTKKKVKWSSSAKKIAYVDKTGYVSGQKKGTAVITAKVGTKKLTCKVTVKEKPQISSKSETLCVGGKGYLYVTGTAKKVTWKSSKPKVVKVNKKGVITGKKLGKATITAKVGKKTMKCKVTVSKAVKVQQSSLAIENGGVIELDYYSNNVSVKSADSTIAKVGLTDWGNYAEVEVYGVKTGTTTVIITNDCNKEAVTVKVTVNKPEAKGGQILVDWLIQNGELTDDGHIGIQQINDTETLSYAIEYNPLDDVVVMGYVEVTDSTMEAGIINLDYRTNAGTVSVMYSTLEAWEILTTNADFNTYEGQGFIFTDAWTLTVASETLQEKANDITAKTLSELEKLLNEKANLSFVDFGMNGIVLEG